MLETSMQSTTWYLRALLVQRHLKAKTKSRRWGGHTVTIMPGGKGSFFNINQTRLGPKDLGKPGLSGIFLSYPSSEDLRAV